MKALGIIGGIAPASTVEYYQSIIKLVRERRDDGHYPSILINSIDMKKMLDMIGANDLEGVTAYITSEIIMLARAGAEIAFMASNTPHIVFNEIQRRSPIPLVSIVGAAALEAKRLGLKRLGLFGTRSTMQGRFYPDAFATHGMTIVVPPVDELNYIHEKYMSELVVAVFKDETRAKLLSIASRLKQTEGIDGLVLGGTELPLILRDSGSTGIPFLDTTKIHVREIVERMVV